jgi:hypothetical protein
MLKNPSGGRPESTKNNLLWTLSKKNRRLCGTTRGKRQDIFIAACVLSHSGIDDLQAPLVISRPHR